MGGLLVGIWVARYLGPEQYGLFNYVVAFVGLFGVLATLGVDQIVIHDIVKYPVDTNEIIGTAFSLKLFGSTLALGTALITMKIMRPDDTLTLTLVGIIATGLVFSSFDTIDLLFQAQVRSKYTVYAKDGAFLVIVGVKIVLVLLNAPLTAFALAGLAEIILGTSGLILFYQRHSARLRDWRISFTRAKALLQLSWPLILTGAANLIYLRIDQVMLGNMVNDTEVGIYAAAVRVSEIWYFIPTVVTSSIYPTLIKLYQDSEERFYDKLKQVMGYFFWGTLILSLLVSAFSNQIIDILYGRDYARAGSVLAIHIYAYVITSMWIVFSQKFIIDDTTKIYFYGMAAGAVSNIILNLWLLPLYGAYGAAITTVISYTMPMLFQTTLFDKRIGLTFLNSVFYPFRDIIKLINKLTH
jgi:PST family polysaccharide transporter